MTPRQLIHYMGKWRKEHHNIYKSADIFWWQFFKELRKQAENLCYECYRSGNNDKGGPYDNEDIDEEEVSKSSEKSNITSEKSEMEELLPDLFDDLVYRKNNLVGTIEIMGTEAFIDIIKKVFSS